ncbi:MAG: hypothetical protein ABFR90_10535 [Planctomycetota bacterium]
MTKMFFAFMTLLPLASAVQAGDVPSVLPTTLGTHYQEWTGCTGDTDCVYAYKLTTHFGGK